MTIVKIVNKTIFLIVKPLNIVVLSLKVFHNHTGIALSGGLQASKVKNLGKQAK